MWPPCFQLLIQKMLLLAFSYQLTPIYVHCCGLGRVFPCQKAIPWDFFLDGPWLPALLCCSHVSSLARSGCTLAEVVLCFIPGADFPSGCARAAPWKQAWAWGHRSGHPSEALPQASAGWVLEFFQVKKARVKIQFNLCVSVLPKQENLGPQWVTHYSQNFPGWGECLIPSCWHKFPSSACPQLSSPRSLFVLFQMDMNEEINGNYQHHKPTVSVLPWWLNSSGKLIFKYSHKLQSANIFTALY